MCTPEMFTPEELNPEKEFLTGVLSLAGDSSHQMELLQRLMPEDFMDPFFRGVFRAFCRILASGLPLKLSTMAAYFKLYSDSSTFIRVCREIQVWEYIDYDDQTAERLKTLAEDLGISSDNQNLVEADEYDETDF